MKKVVGEQDRSSKIFNTFMSSEFSENVNCCINLLFNSRGLKLGHFWYFQCTLSISGILKFITQNVKKFLLKIWSHDPGCKRPTVYLNLHVSIADTSLIVHFGFFQRYTLIMQRSKLSLHVPLLCSFVLTNFDVICDLLLNRLTATWNLLILLISYPIKSLRHSDKQILIVNCLNCV